MNEQSIGERRSAATGGPIAVQTSASSRRDVRGSLDAGTITSGAGVLAGTSKKRGLARILPFLGPAFIACIAYIDPGNFATNIQAGAQFGYLLVWVILAANGIAMLVQSLSAKLGIATGMNLAEAVRDVLPLARLVVTLGRAVDRCDGH